MGSKLTICEKLLWLTLFISILHHTDHILRIDHSGWPFRQGVSPFTYSLLAYPILFVAFIARHRPWLRVVAVAILFVFATTAHIFFEPLRDKYHTWTYGSNMPGHVNEQNMLGIHSPMMGVLSVAIAVLLSVVLLITLVCFIRQARPTR